MNINISTRFAVITTLICIVLFLIVFMRTSLNYNAEISMGVLIYQLPLIFLMLIPLLFFLSKKRKDYKNDTKIIKSTDRINLFIIYPLAFALFAASCTAALLFCDIIYGSTYDESGFGYLAAFAIFAPSAFGIAFFATCIVNIVRYRSGNYLISPLLANFSRWFLLSPFILFILWIAWNSLKD